jgi:phosphoenolpyruvate-protein kinase (PTS system EI component)
VCGETAAEEEGISLLIGLGIREISVTPVAIPTVKERIGRIDCAAAQRLAERALACSDADEVDRLFAADSEHEVVSREGARVTIENLVDEEVP